MTTVPHVPSLLEFGFPRPEDPVHPFRNEWREETLPKWPCATEAQWRGQGPNSSLHTPPCPSLCRIPVSHCLIGHVVCIAGVKDRQPAGVKAGTLYSDSCSCLRRFSPPPPLCSFKQETACLDPCANLSGRVSCIIFWPYQGPRLLLPLHVAAVHMTCD